MVESTCILHTSSHPDKYNNSVNRIISKEKEREDIQGEILQSLSTVFPHTIQQLQVILHTELTLLQEISKKYYNYKAHPVHTDRRHPPATVPVHPSILHGRIRLPTPLQAFQGPTAQAGSQQFYPAETAF